MGVAPSAARVEYPPYWLYEGERRFIGSNSLADQYPAAAQLMPELAEAVLPLVTNTYPLDDFGAALAAMADPATVKVQLVPGRA
jgi:threonine dehydrogenase-like Zn-dependent dehydrogenase